ncbi:MAG TPA: hypothetical protein VN823_20775 [Stellaceae bacterium]|nr:hypothetical protein [Stellaceae bacterium]
MNARVGYPTTMFLPTVNFTGDEIKGLEDAGGLKLDAASREHLALALEAYLEEPTLLAAFSRPAEVSAELVTLGKLAHSFSKAALEIFSESPSKKAALDRLTRPPSHLSEDRLREMAAFTAELGGACDAAIQGLPRSRRGRESDPGMAPLIRNLHSVFLAAGGVGTQTYDIEYRGPFLDFVRVALVKIGQDLPASTVGSRIHEAFKSGEKKSARAR